MTEMHHDVLDRALSAIAETGAAVLLVDPDLELLVSDAVWQAGGVHFLVASAVHALSIGDVIEFRSGGSSPDPVVYDAVVAALSDLTSRLRLLADELPTDMAKPSEPPEMEMAYQILTFLRDVAVLDP